MIFLSFVYRFVTNFAFMAMVYFSLNFMEKYQNRAIIAILVLVYAAMRAASTLRAFYFFQKIEKLEAETRRLQGPINDGSGERTRASRSSPTSRGCGATASSSPIWTCSFSRSSCCSASPPSCGSRTQARFFALVARRVGREAVVLACAACFGAACAACAVRRPCGLALFLAACGVSAAIASRVAARRDNVVDISTSTEPSGIAKRVRPGTGRVAATLACAMVRRGSSG